LARILYK